MFSFLIFVGFSIIILGVYLGKSEQSYQSDQNIIMNELMQRIINIESVLYGNNSIVSNDEKFDFIDDYSFEEDIKPISPQPKFEEPIVQKKDPAEILSLYESGKYTLDEVCEILDMQKGEVLLLKNLSKKYRK